MKITKSSEKYTARWWQAQITHVENKRREFRDSAEESIKLYNAKKQIAVMDDVERRLNVWWYVVNTLIPAYYSSTPKAEVNLRKRTGGVPYQIGSVILERNIQYCMDNHFNFDQVGYLAGLQFLLTGQAVLWPRYLPEFATEMMETADVTDGGVVVAQEEVERKVSEKAILDFIHYPDYLCNDARDESEIEWQGRRAFLTRDAVKEMFGGDIAKALSYDTYPDAIKRDDARKEDQYEGKAELVEIWCEASGKVYWVSRGGDKKIVESGDPPTQFEQFYPCSVIRQSVNPDSVIPVSDYCHVKDQILEVERLTTRIHATLQAIRSNSVYDATLGTQVEELLTGDLKMIPVTNWPAYKGRGGLANGVETFNIEPYVNALNTLQSARQAALQQLYETLKVSDLLRGTSEQYKSATANRLENQWSSLGLIVRQNMFTKFVSDAIANLGTIIAQHFEPETLLEVGDADGLLMPLLEEPQVGPDGMPVGMPPEEQLAAMKEQVIAILKDPKARSYRIQIASDSMVAIDQQQQQQEGARLMEAAGQFFEQMKGLVLEYPPMLGFSISLFQNMIKRVKGGKELDGLFTKALGDIGEIARAKEEAAKQPPPPDPVMQEVQGRLQIAQIESQARLQATQMELSDKQQKNAIAIEEMRLRMQRDALEAQLKVQDQQLKEFIAAQEMTIKQQEVAVKGQGVQVDLLKVQTTAETEQAKAAIKQEAERMGHILEIQSQQLEQMKIQLSEAEKLMEERRLNSEQQLERIRLSMEQTVKGGQSNRKKVGKLVTDDNGNPVAIEVTEVPETKVQKIIMDEEGNPTGIEME